MSLFAPVYRPTKHQQTFLTRSQKHESKKRKRGEDTSDGEDVQSGLYSEPEAPKLGTTAYHPVNKKDPYYVAGHTREGPLPLPPFPHAAVKERGAAKPSIEEELAGLNPPLYVPPSKPDDKSTSLRRRHLDNLTTILHRCMLKGDWQRASRAWALLIRTEIAGRGIDVRRNGRWGIGAELLMRQGGDNGQGTRYEITESVDRNSANEMVDAKLTRFSDEGFKLAREYYERLILQYPHTQYSQHSLNAAAIYPALFNIWVYEVQDRSKRARQKSSSPPSGLDDSMSDSSFVTGQTTRLRNIRSEELEQALPIAQKMDELLLGPPYDTSSSLLQLRGMVALWISDLHDTLSEALIHKLDALDNEDPMSSIDFTGWQDIERHKVEAENSRQKARDLFDRLTTLGVDLPREALTFTTEQAD